MEVDYQDGNDSAMTEAGEEAEEQEEDELEETDQYYDDEQNVNQIETENTGAVSPSDIDDSLEMNEYSMSSIISQRAGKSKYYIIGPK
jgi:hypothetical protein